MSDFFYHEFVKDNTNIFVSVNKNTGKKAKDVFKDCKSYENINIMTDSLYDGLSVHTEFETQHAIGGGRIKADDVKLTQSTIFTVFKPNGKVSHGYELSYDNSIKTSKLRLVSRTGSLGKTIKAQTDEYNEIMQEISSFCETKGFDKTTSAFVLNIINLTKEDRRVVAIPTFAKSLILKARELSDFIM